VDQSVDRSDADAIEGALANALEAATGEGRWHVVAQLARELEARRLARATNVVALGAKRREGRS
jgi:2C-methyl-D-erythritol 2,4-cyclodiphosphate synthase